VRPLASLRHRASLVLTLKDQRDVKAVTA